MTIDFERHQQLAELARISQDPRLLALIGPANSIDRTDVAVERLKRKFFTLARFCGVFKARRD